MFGKEYSSYYDLLYGDKDYEREVQYVENLLEDLSPIKVKRIIDVACGTGGHVIPLAKRGFKVLGMDISTHMLKIAREKSKDLAIDHNISFRPGDMRSYQPLGKFDACLCMFAALGYLSDHQQVLAALNSMHRHLRGNGLLIFDVWNGLAVMSIKPSRRTKRIRRSGIILTRRAKSRLDTMNSTCTVKYDLVVKGLTSKIEKFSETHRMRYFYPDELGLLLKLSGFNLLSLHPFLRPADSLTPHDWNMTAVAKAVYR